MIKPILLFSHIFLLTITMTQGQKAGGYQIFDAKGKKVSFEKMTANLEKGDIILFGELHNDPIAHWLQYEVALFLANKNKVIFGAEMFEADNQKGLDKYLKGEITEEDFQKEVRLWNNYKTDYSKMVTLAKERNISYVATNIPRKYASMVFKGGFEVLDTLSQEEKSWITPLPMEYDPTVGCYKKMLEMDMGEHKPTEKFPKAQAVKDATMSHFILKNFVPGTKFLHLNGSFHSDNYEGILWYLKRKAPKLNYKTISTVYQKNPGKLEKGNQGIADFIICVDEDMTTTY
jgi:uncharacterized iron-regulated protein